VQLGQVVGHAIAAVERKRALVSEEVVELRFRVRDLLVDAGRTFPAKGTIAFDRMISIDAGTFLAYGTATEVGAGTLDSLVEHLPYFEGVKHLDADATETRFELTLSAPPAVTEIAAYGGRIESIRIENGDFELVVQVPSGTDIQELVQVVRNGYPDAEVVAQRRRTRTEPSISSLGPATRATLTERQRAVLEAAYRAGFFEWPRVSNGEEIADSLEIAPSTFHQHVRMSERKLMQVLFGEPATAP
jgi:antitoxin (DNA-binding transcriptional repressor) of toxin-antitoxin stability system